MGQGRIEKVAQAQAQAPAPAPRTVSPTDLRLVPAALAAWGLRGGSRPSGRGCPGRGRGGRRAADADRRVDARAAPAPTSGLGQCLLVTACTLAVLLGGVAHLVGREAGNRGPRRPGRDRRGRRPDRPRAAVATNPGRGRGQHPHDPRPDRGRGRGVAAPAGSTVDVLGDLAWDEVAYGSELRASGTLLPAEPGDEAAATLVATGPPVVTDEPSSALRVVNALRADLLTASDALPADARALLPGVAVGDTSRIDDELDAALKTTGLTHVTAVSGGHFAIIVATVTALCALARLRAGAHRRDRHGDGGFVLLVHPDPSVLRAAAMGVFGLVGIGLGRPSRAVPALASIVVVLLVLDPWLARSYGFVLSSVATAALVLGTQPVARRLAPWIGKAPPSHSRYH
ncbi:ComEC/Rec2 family competence protein [Oerskovia sp. M15]